MPPLDRTVRNVHGCISKYAKMIKQGPGLKILPFLGQRKDGQTFVVYFLLDVFVACSKHRNRFLKKLRLERKIVKALLNSFIMPWKASLILK